MDAVPLIVLTLLGVVGAGVGVTVAVRGGDAPPVPRGGEEQGLLRLSAKVHTGWEQTLIGLTRELALPRRAEDLQYGQLYVDARNEFRTLVRSRSEIGRGFLGSIDIVPARRSTTVRYSILRLPGDDRVRGRVLDLELQLITALRRVDIDVELQLEAGALRELDRIRSTTPSAGE